MMNIDYPTIWSVLSQHFMLGERSMHGPHHWKNVEIYGLMLSRKNGADNTVIRLFAIFHDCERLSEGCDPGHGQRSVQLVRQLHGDLFQLDKNQLELLCDACEFHQDGMTSCDVTIGTCCDADRLDLWMASKSDSCTTSEASTRTATRGSIR
jgi:uncharacterized protein